MPPNIPAWMRAAAVELPPSQPTDGLPRIITIDGESATGKTTQAELVATRLGYHNLTSGTLFCASALALEQVGVSPVSTEALAAVQDTAIDIAHVVGGRPLVSIGGRDISERLFTFRTKQIAGVLGSIPAIAHHNEQLLRNLLRTGRWVVDRGTHIAPDADLKIWLTADPYCRAVRRCGQLALEGEYKSIGNILAAAQARSHHDNLDTLRRDRTLSIDTTHRTIEETYTALAHAIIQNEHV